MNNNQTIEKLKKMRLNTMATLHEQCISNNRMEQLTADEYLALLTEQEWDARFNRRIKNLIKQAQFREQADLSDVKYTPERNLDKNMFMRLGTLDFIGRKENLIITGASGTGKSYIAQALGNEACIMEHRVLYTVTSKLLLELKHSKIDGTYLKMLNKIKKVNLLIFDDFGLQAFDNITREIILDIIDERHKQASTIIASQVPVSAWYALIGEGTVADAILDRIVNSSHRINLEGESLRKNQLKID